VDDSELAELYYRTTLELADSAGQIWRITPTDTEPMSPAEVLAPYTDAFILTAENPESSGENTAADNARATRALQADLESSGLVFRDCPGFGFDVDHVEHGFALFADEESRESVRAKALELATTYRQNAIFHLHRDGLGIIGALRPEMAATRTVSLQRA